MATAVASCKADCAANDLCTAFELHKTKKVRNKKKGKKKSKGYKCELHKATINSSTRKRKSCKKAKCFTKETSVPEVAPTGALTLTLTLSLTLTLGTSWERAVGTGTNNDYFVDYASPSVRTSLSDRCSRRLC